MKILISDPHLAPFRAEKFLTQEKNFIEAVIQYFASKFEDKEREAKIFASIRLIIEKEGIKVGYFNGDFMESRRTERGMNTREDLEMMCQLRVRVFKEIGIEDGEFNLGNHESGYDLALGTDPERGINLAAIKNFLIFVRREELYHSFYVDGCKVIFVPYIFSEEAARDFDLGAEKKKFLAKMQQDLVENIPTILLVHDPDSFDDPELLQLIRENRDKIKFIFYGHYHSWINLFFMRILSRIYSSQNLGACRWILDRIFSKLAKGDTRIVEELGKYFSKRKNITAIIKELGATLTPAPSGTFGIGGGCLVLDCEKGKVKKYTL
jgi:hypothetical protein